jgi:hypothetical protein
MRPLFAAALVAWAAAGLAAADFWASKPYTEWSEKEVEQMLGDSPWARKISVVVPIPPRASADGAGGRGGRGGDDGLGRGFPVPAPQLKLVLTWRSALPIRQALTRQSNGAGNATLGLPLLEEQQYYIVTLAGLPAVYARATASAGPSTFLRRGRKPPIALAQGGMQQTGPTLTLVFAFPRTDPIALDDKDVEFVTALGSIEIKKKFSLKDLVYNGELEL